MEKKEKNYLEIGLQRKCGSKVQEALLKEKSATKFDIVNCAKIETAVKKAKKRKCAEMKEKILWSLVYWISWNIFHVIT